MATTKFYLNHPFKKGTKTFREDEVPIDLVFSINRTNRFVVTTGERIIPKYWNASAQEAKANYRAHIELNSHLRQLKTDVTDIWRNNKNASPQQLKELVRIAVKGELDNPIQKKTVIEVLESLIIQYSKEKDKKTSQKFSSLKMHLVNYAKKHPLSFEGMDFKFYDQFKNFLYVQPNNQYPNMFLHEKGSHWEMSEVKSNNPVGLMDDTVYKYIINLKIFLTWAGKRGYNVSKGYEDWPIIQREYEPIYLTMDELNRIENAEITAQSVIDRLGVNECYLPIKAGIIAKAIGIARDYLALECRTAQRISDLFSFNINNVANFKWTFIQNKGSRLKAKQVTVPFSGYCAPAYLILQRHNFQMPKISNQKLNDNIKNVCKIAGINQEIYIERWAGNKKIRISGTKYEFISTHTGRKTFITLGLQLGVPESIVMDLAGITSTRTLKKYKGPAEQSVVEQWLDKMEDNMSLMRKSS